MKQFLIKYLLWFFSFLTIIIFYLLQTTLGHQTLADFLSSYLSKKTKNHLEVSSLKIDAYPILEMNVTVNNGAMVHLKGTATKSRIEIDYHLVGDSFHYNNIVLKDKLNIKGHILGILSEALIRGQGEVCDGRTEFDFIKTPKAFKDINVHLSSVNSEKVLNFLHYKPLVIGKADIDAKFKIFSKYHKDGKALILMQNANMPTVSGVVPFGLKTEIRFKDIEYLYKGGIKSKIGNLTIVDGCYNQSTHEASAKYAIDLKELAYFEPFLKRKYHGSFDSEGSIHYKNGFHVTGKSNKFEGLLAYEYHKKSLELKLEGVSLIKLLNILSYPALLSAKVYGSIDYDMTDKIVLINTKLRETKFRKTKMTDMIFNSTGINMLNDVYNNSSFVGGYQYNILKSTLKIDNGLKHVYLTDTVMNSKTNSIKSKFEVEIAGNELYGDIYGTLDNPKVSINMQKLLKYQLNKQIGNFLGTENKEAIKKELKSVTEDVSKTLEEIDVNSVKEKAKSFLNGFF